MQVVGLDFAKDMLEDAAGQEADRLQSLCEQSAPMEWVPGDALQLPFGAASFGAATMGYGLRNVTDIPQALSELHRVSSDHDLHELSACPPPPPPLGGRGKGPEGCCLPLSA